MTFLAGVRDINPGSDHGVDERGVSGPTKTVCRSVEVHSNDGGVGVIEICCRSAGFGFGHEHRFSRDAMSARTGGVRWPGRQIWASVDREAHAAPRR